MSLVPIIKIGGIFISDFIRFCSLLDGKSTVTEDLKKAARDNFEVFGVYPDSLQVNDGTFLFITWNGAEKVLALYGNSKTAALFEGIEADATGLGSRLKLCPLSSGNSAVIRQLFPFTRPVSHKGHPVTIGLGDRLGLASAGHVRLLKNSTVFPVLAQQSIRELNLTGRSYVDVLASVVWAVFQEGYMSGYGADGDHLKTADEVRMALDCGYTMITLDCSEYIDNASASIPYQEVEARYGALPAADTSALEKKYMGREFLLKDGSRLFFEEAEFKRMVLVYLNAIKHAVYIFSDIIKSYGRDVDFEMSIDETLTSTSPESHFFVASELISRGVEVASLAPRFCGEFQKGIDYKGDIAQFEKEFAVHVKIAEHFGYKVSVHSGSDKFSVFPIIGRLTGGRYHLKTAGTNWLEGVRIIADVNPELYRRMHRFAVQHLQEARKYYHISAQTERVPDLDKLKDSELPGLMDMEDARQVLHITYGLILLAKNPEGTPVFRREIYDTLEKYEKRYYDALQKHIGRHLRELGIRG